MEIDIKYDKFTFKMTFKEITGICGKSGSGKTLLAEILAGLIHTNKTKKQLKEIGYIFQDPAKQLFCTTVKEEIEFGPKQFKKKCDINHIKQALQMVNLNDDILNQNPLTLSSGEMKKVAIASILAYNPKIIILDEPTINLDNKSIESLIKLIKMLKKRYNKTIIIMSKDTDFLHKVCDNIGILYDNKIVLSGNKYDVFTKDIEKYGLKKPKIIAFEQLVKKEKNIKLLYRDDINDLMKDVYRHVV